MDYILTELFGTASDPVELACRFLIVILILDGIFGIVSALLRSFFNH